MLISCHRKYRFVVSCYIMRTVLIAISFLCLTYTFGQNCSCEKDAMLKEIISCDTIKFDNKAKLFWNFNCDSSWLTFESPSHKKEIIFSLGEGLQNMTGRLGYIYVQEYKNTFLIQNNVISGCCSPPDFYLYDKNTGQKKSDLGRLIFYSEDKKNPLVIGVTNSSYDTIAEAAYNSLTIYNVDKDKKYFVQLSKGQIEKALEETEQIYPEYLFDEPIIRGDTIILTYYLRKAKSNSDKPVKVITIDKKKYSR